MNQSIKKCPSFFDYPAFISLWQQNFQEKFIFGGTMPYPQAQPIRVTL